MGRFDLTRTQGRWTLGVLATMVASIGAFIVLRRAAPEEIDPLGMPASSIAAEVEPGTYALVNMSWAPAGQTAHSGRGSQPPGPKDEDETIDPAAEEETGLPLALRELDGMPISVGGR